MATFDLVPVEDTPSPVAQGGVPAAGGMFDLVPVNEPPQKLGVKGGMLDTVANAIPDSVTNSMPFRALAGVGGGLVQRGLGAIQGGAEMLGADDTANAARGAISDVNQNLQGAGIAGKVGQFAGDVAPLFAAPGVGVAALADAATKPSEEAQGLGERATNAALDYAGGKAATAIGGSAMRYLKGTPNVAAETLGATPGNTRDSAEAVQDILTTQHSKVSGKENALWTKARAEAEGQKIPYKNIGDLQNILIQSPSGDPVLAQKLTMLNRFVDGGIDVPAQTVLDIRQALSKASTRDASLRETVGQLDDVLGGKLSVKSLGEAIKTSRTRFENFVDQKAVARTIADGATPETAAKLFNPSDPQAATTFDHVLKAVKNTGGDVATAKQNMQYGIANNLLSSAVKSADREGGALVHPETLANNIQSLRSNNQSLWKLLPIGTRQTLSELEQGLRPHGGLTGKVIGAAKGAIGLGLKAAPGMVGDAINGAMAGEKLIPMSKILGKLKMPTVTGEAPVVAPVRPEGAITRSPMSNQRGSANGDTAKALSAGSAAGLGGAAYFANKNRPGGEPNPEGQAAMVSMPPPPVQVPVPVSATMPQHDELGDFIKSLPPAQAISRTVIASEEATRPKSYTDKNGFKTVGTGFNMDAPNAKLIWKRAGVPERFDDVYNGKTSLSNGSIQSLFHNTSAAAEKAAQKLVPNYDQLGDNQKAALNSLVFQLGSKGLGKFRNMLNYLAQGNAKAVENSLINSKLGQQDSPARARRTALMLAYDMPHEQADALLAQQGRIKPNQRKYR